MRTKATIRQRHSHKNREIFSLLINKSPFRRICEVADINPRTLYQRIDFFYRQCRAFAADRERPLLDGMKIRRLYLASDRQDYVVNWAAENDKRNVIMRAIGTADHQSGYVFGMHLDYDPTADKDEIEKSAKEIGDDRLPAPHRRYARLWLQSDYLSELRAMRHKRRGSARAAALAARIKSAYEEAENRPDVEVAPQQSPDTRLPSRGMQVHAEYSMYGHFFYLSRLFRGVEKVRFYMDQESAIRAACLTAFKDGVKTGRVDAFYVRTNKDMTINEKRMALAASRARLEIAMKARPELSKRKVEHLLIRQSLQAMTTVGKWSDKWVMHPFPDMSEPEKAMCCLTDTGKHDIDHLARLYAKASLHAIDRFFMQTRRRLSLLERPISSASSDRRTWHGYSPYNPAVVVKLLFIFRVAYNYVLAGKDGRTPAMRLGLAKGKNELEDIIYFVAKAPLAE